MTNCFIELWVRKNTNGLRKVETFRNRVANLRKYRLFITGSLKKLIRLMGISVSNIIRVTSRTTKIFFILGEDFTALDFLMANQMRVKLERARGKQGAPNSARVRALCTVWCWSGQPAHFDPIAQNTATVYSFICAT